MSNVPLVTQLIKNMLPMDCASHVIKKSIVKWSGRGKMKNSIKQSITGILLDYTQLLVKKGIIGDNIMYHEVLEPIREMINNPDFIHKVHYELCDCQKEKPSDE